MPRDCLILLTHIWSPGLARHVERLKREAAGTIDVFLVLHTEPGRPVPTGIAPDFTVSMSDAQRIFPARSAHFREHSRKGSWSTYIDRLWFAAFLHDRLAGYDRFWFIEYDVDLKGHWGRFFATASAYEGDLLATRLRRLNSSPPWAHTSKLRMPAGITDPVAGLLCISRLSRPLVEAYVAAMAGPEWDGHLEAMIPTLAEFAGFSVAEIGGEGSFTPPERLNRHYRGGPHEGSSFRTTFSFRPPHAYRYFAERPFRAGKRDTLYHPVKTDVPLRQRLRFLEQDFRFLIHPPGP
jgi:hypothetical protein